MTLTIEDFRELHEIRENPEERAAALSNRVREGVFRRFEENEWAYRKVLSYLEDGWNAAREYGDLQDSLIRGGLGKDFVFQIINKVVGGLREDTVDQGEWPTAWDMAAFVFYHTHKPPEKLAAA